MTTRRCGVTLLHGLLATAMSACAANAPAPPPAQQPPAPLAASPSVPMPEKSASDGDSAALLREIVGSIGDAACTTDADCRSVGVGEKACGGPEAYLAWSITTTRPAVLAGLVSRHRTARQRDHERSGLLSTCAVVPDPGAVCRARAADGKRTCQAGRGGGASAV